MRHTIATRTLPLWEKSNAKHSPHQSFVSIKYTVLFLVAIAALPYVPLHQTSKIFLRSILFSSHFFFYDYVPHLKSSSVHPCQFHLSLIEDIPPSPDTPSHTIPELLSSPPTSIRSGAAGHSGHGRKWQKDTESSLVLCIPSW